MRRRVALAALAALAPFVVWRTAAEGLEDVPSTPSWAQEAGVPSGDGARPPAETTVPPTTTDDALAADSTSTTSTTIDPTAPTTTIDPNAPTTTVDPNAPTTTVDPNASTTTVDPNVSTTTVDPNAPTTTVDPETTTSTTTTIATDTTTVTPTTVDPAPPATTVDPGVTPTTVDPGVPVVVEDVESAPVPLPVVVDSGRVVASGGVVESGLTRPIVFPVAGPVTYGNDFGACRDGCARSHKGIDVIGDRLQPLVAMHGGVVDRVLDHPTAGHGVVIRDDEGWEYHVYHVNNDAPGTDDGSDDGSWRYAAGITPGVRVVAGQLIAWMGDSGNSEGSVPHAHVEIHLPDGRAINPYWSLRLAQRDATCAQPTTPASTEAAVVDDPVVMESVAAWFDTGWSTAPVPVGWRSVALSGGHPGSGSTMARMWISPDGFTPVDAAALQTGDPRYDQSTDCTSATDVGVTPTMPAELGPILATIRAMETGGDYTVQVTTSTASGAYGFLDSSWANYGGYARARDAPPAVQDTKAAWLASSILARNNGDVTTIPVSWYIGHVPRGAEWDRVPPYPGNNLTPRQYQERWMRTYAKILGSPNTWVGTSTTWTPIDTTTTCHTTLIDVGTPTNPNYALTQTSTYTIHTTGTPTGRVTPTPTDPCDPTRQPVAVPTPAQVAVTAAE